MKNSKPSILAAGIALALALATSSASAAVFSFDVTGTESWDTPGSPNNTVVVLDLAAELGFASGTSILVDGIGWDVTISTVGVSWLSDATLTLTGDGGGVGITPGVADEISGSSSYSSGGILDLAGFDLDFVASDGLITLEFFETFDDAPGAIDAIWDSGIVDIQGSAAVIPLPAALPMFVTALFGGMLASRRKRTETAAAA